MSVPGRVRPIQRDSNSERYEIRDRFPRIGEVILANIDVSTDSHETGITLTRDNTFTSFPRRSLGSKVEGERFDFKPHLFIVKNVFISFVEQHDKAVRNENVYNWLRNIPSV
jgi:hypothetical protein